MQIFKIFWKEYLSFFMVSSFVIGRVLRNSFFYAKDGVGGVWNYISLCFLLLYFLSFFQVGNWIKRSASCIKSKKKNIIIPSSKGITGKAWEKIIQHSSK